MSQCVCPTARSGRVGVGSRPGEQWERRGRAAAAAFVSPKIASGKAHEPPPVAMLAPQEPGTGGLYPAGVAAANTTPGAIRCIWAISIFQDNFCHGLGLSQFVTKIILKNQCSDCHLLGPTKQWRIAKFPCWRHAQEPQPRAALHGKTVRGRGWHGIAYPPMQPPTGPHGPACPRLSPCGLARPRMGSHGPAWPRAASHDLAWPRMTSHGLRWPRLASHVLTSWGPE